MRTILVFLFGWLTIVSFYAQSNQTLFDFEYKKHELSGILNIPQGITPKGIILIVHGSGQTNALEDKWYLDVRERLVQSGYTTYMWDKMGCGNSEGTFDYNQTVQSSASEVIAAINKLKAKGVSGCETIGLWGISRAGWINPLVINQYEDISFWISVSGVDDKENFKYLLKQNLRINGHTESRVKLLVDEWQAGTRITHAGGSFEEYRNATSNIRKNKFMSRFMNGAVTKRGYYNYQKSFIKEAFDEESGLQVYIEDFQEILSNINCPVLALFGESDMNVDWKKTKTLYENTLAKNSNLTVKSFPNCNHNMFRCKTGGFYEFEDDQLPWNRCDGFLNAMTAWLEER